MTPEQRAKECLKYHGFTLVEEAIAQAINSAVSEAVAEDRKKHLDIRSCNCSRYEDRLKRIVEVLDKVYQELGKAPYGNYEHAPKMYHAINQALSIARGE